MRDIHDIIEELKAASAVPVHPVRTITIFSDGTIDVQEMLKEVMATPATHITPFVPRTGNHCFHNSTYYKSIVEASKKTGVKRYWVDRWCKEEKNGWRFA